MLGPTRALCPIRRTTNGNCCAFPFVYQKKERNTCTSEESEDLWCQTSSINEQGQMSGFCDRKCWRLNIPALPIPPYVHIFEPPLLHASMQLSHHTSTPSCLHFFISPFLHVTMQSSLHPYIPPVLHSSISPPF